MSEDRYQPYQYGVPEEPKFEEPDLEEVKAKEENEPRFAEPEFEAVDVEAEVIEPEIPRYDYNYSYSQPTNASTQQPKDNREKGGCLKVFGVIALAIVFGVVASVIFQGTNRLINGMFGDWDIIGTEKKEEIGSTQIVTGGGSTVQSDIADVAERVMPSVVSITNISIQEVQHYFFGGTTQYEVPSSGSGIIVGQNDTELLIATNNHVIEGSKTLTVAFIDGSSANAQVKGTDSDIDLAIIAISLKDLKNETLDKIKVATLGDSDKMRVGEPAIAIGNALGYG